MNDGNRSDTSTATAGMSLPRPGDEIELNAAPMPVSLPYFSRHALSVLSAGFFISSFPSPDLGWLAWIALVPLLIACHGTSARRAAALGFLNGFVAAFGIYNWLFQLPVFGWRHAFVLATYVALYPSLFCFALAIFARWRAPLILSAPALWTVVEYLRANAGFLALPWGTLAQAQHENLAILQFASIAGEHGVTYLVALGNATIAQMILGWFAYSSSDPAFFPNGKTSWSENIIFSRPMLVAVAIITLAHAWGAWVLFAAQTGRTIFVAAVQPNIQIAERESKKGSSQSFQRLEQLTQTAAAAKPDLIVWPESAVAGNLHNDGAMVAALRSMIRTINVPVVVGAAEVQKFSTGERETTIRSQVFNSAYLLEPATGLSQPYRKRMLLPFGEYLPYAKTIPWPEWLAPKVSEMTPGEEPYLFQLPDGVKVGVLICWENLFSRLVRDSVASGARVLVQLTNDVWFGKTAAPLQHNLASILRAVENRVPVVIASNTGPSEIIDAYGRVTARMPNIFSAGITEGTIHPGVGRSPYGTWGDFFVLLLIVVLLLYSIFKSNSHEKTKTITVEIKGEFK